MKKSREPEEEAEGNSERWLLTYSDMITLLLALFIILYSMSSIQAKKFEEIAKMFGSAFHTTETSGGNVSFNGDGTGSSFLLSSSGVSSSSEASSSGGESSGAGSGSGGGADNPLDEIYTTLSQYVAQNNLQEEITLEDSQTYVRIRIQGVLMFYPDSVQMLSSSGPILQKIADALSTIYDKVDHITISGHTATVGEENQQNNEVAWALSINRADMVREMLVKYGLQEDKISLEGYGHNVPVTSNDTEEGRAKNRRAEITVYKYN